MLFISSQKFFSFSCNNDLSFSNADASNASSLTFKDRNKGLTYYDIIRVETPRSIVLRNNLFMNPGETFNQMTSQRLGGFSDAASQTYKHFPRGTVACFSLCS